jgi:site-specific recombinase XerD
MVYLKLILDTRRAKSDDTYPIVFRVTEIKKVYLLSSGYSTKKSEWDVSKRMIKGIHPNAGAINASLSKRFYEIQKAIVQLEDTGTFTIENLKESLKPKIQIAVKPTTFLEFSNSVINEFIIVKRTGNALIYLTAVNRLIKYCNDPKIKLNEINYSLLNGFKNKLLQEGLKQNSIGNYLRSIRAIFNKAIKAKLITREYYPFHEISIKTQKTAKRAITIEQLSKIYQYPKKNNSQEWHATNYFFLSFALRGMSFTDMAYLTTENILKDQIIYRRRKTQKLYTITIHPFALTIMDYYKDNYTPYLIPIFNKGIVEDSIEAKKITRQWIKTTNKYLNRIAANCGCDNNITTYVARHTWATTAKKMGYSNEIIAEALGHEYGNKITNIYLDSFDQEIIDNVNKCIINLLINF